MDKKKIDFRLSLLCMVAISATIYTVSVFGEVAVPSNTHTPPDNINTVSSSLNAGENIPAPSNNNITGEVQSQDEAGLLTKASDKISDGPQTVSGAASHAEIMHTSLAELNILQEIFQQKVDLSVKETSRLRESVAALTDLMRATGYTGNDKIAEQLKQISELSESGSALQLELEEALSRVRSFEHEKYPLLQQALSGSNNTENKRVILEEKMTAVETQLNNIYSEWDQIKLLLDGAHKADRKETILATDELRSELETEEEKQAYASGVVFSRDIAQMRAIHADLGVNLSKELMLEGLNDGVNNTIQLDEVSLRNSHQALATHLASLEKEKYDSGLKKLEALTAKSTILKRNKSMFFVQKRKRSGVIRYGSQVTFDLTESVVDGKTLRAEQGVTAVADDSLPYIVREALMLAGRGGEINVYCMASDVYSSGAMPEGIYPYSLLKFNVKVSVKIKK